ncbi:MAG: spermidine synthase [Nitrospirae bacterium]|nr:spermidine synthase [Nitrospirota bacterium]
MRPGYRKIFFLLFTLSGFSGLIYESIWTHYLKLFLGHAAYAQTLVLAIFMSGMALGSWICSRYSAGWKRLFIGYAAAEVLIGIFALVFHTVFDQAVRLSYSVVIPALDSPAGITAFKWSLSALLIMPQTILLGMTFPLMSSGILRAFPDRPGRSISLLYFTNSIGAAIGVLVSGFMLIKSAGLPGTNGTAGFINIAIGASTWLLVRKHPAQPLETAKVEDGIHERPGITWYRFLLAASLITGTASFIYEIGWIRMLNLVLGSSTHAFELMLSAFIFGLAFGGLWIQRRIDRIANPVRFLGVVQILMGLLALSTLLLYGNTFEVMQWIIKSLSRTDTGYTIFNLSISAIALAVMLPATFCAGMTLPLITYTLIKKGHGEQSIGAVYAANTIGAIAGVFLAVHFGMPLLGIKGLITLGCGLDITLGLALLWSAEANYHNRRIPVIVSVLCVCAVIANLLFVELDPYKMASGVYRDGALKSRQYNNLLYHKDGKTATVSVFSSPDNTMNIRTNGKVDALIGMSPGGEPTEDEPTMALLAAIPMALNPAARTVANIGLGSGLTTEVLLQNSSLDGVDTVEIEPAMVEGAKIFRQRVGSVFTDPRSKIHIDDAKTFFSMHNKKYDIIISEPSNPWVSGVAGLFSEEFYRLVSLYLTKDGLFCQWIQLYEIDLDLVVSVLKAVSSNFSDFVVYATTDADLLIVAGNGNAIAGPDDSLFQYPGIARELRKVHIENIQDIEVRKIGNRKALGRFIDSYPMRANSDYHPVLDQNAARTQFLKTNAQELLGYTHEPLPAAEMLMGTVPAWEETNVTEGRYISKARAASMAMALRDYFMHGNFGSTGKVITDEVMGQAVELKRLFSEDCGPESRQTDRLFNLYNIANRMTPYLRPAELDALWNTLESGACARVLTETEREWIGLFKAVGRRDAKAMSDTARSLLEKERDLPEGPTRYLVASGMLGSLVKGDKGESLRLWNNYKSRIYGTDRPSLLFRILAAESME